MSELTQRINHFLTLSYNGEPTTTLYRGDSSKIDEFDVNKTNKGCLYGRGIYLTTDPDVANTYRTKGFLQTKTFKRKKGVDVGINHPLYSGFDNKSVALAKAFEQFITYFDENGNFLNHPRKDTRHPPKILSKIETEWELLVRGSPATGLIINRGKTTTSVIKNNKSQLTTIDSITITYNKVWQPGKVSVFKFPTFYLTRNIIDVDRRLHEDPGIEEIFFSTFNLLEREKYRYFTMASVLRLENINPSYVRELYEPYGYHGLKHKGGVVTGGVRHMVYVLWDSEYVNRHKVK